MKQNKKLNHIYNFLIILSSVFYVSQSQHLTNETRIIIIVFINAIYTIFIRRDLVKKNSEIISHIELLNREVLSLKEEIKNNKMSSIKLNSSN